MINKTYSIIQEEKNKKRNKKGKGKKKKICCKQCGIRLEEGQPYICVLRGNRLVDRQKKNFNKHDKVYHICNDSCLSRFIRKKVRKETFLLYRYNIMKAVMEYD